MLKTHAAQKTAGYENFKVGDSFSDLTAGLTVCHLESMLWNQNGESVTDQLRMSQKCTPLDLEKNHGAMLVHCSIH